MFANLIDVRGRLPVNPSGGPSRQLPLAEKRGVVIHYAGPPLDLALDEVEMICREARYHCGKVWGYGATGEPLHGDGLMYHLVVGREGALYLCRDLESVLWHCGAWPANGHALSVQVPIGGEQRASAAQIRALAALCDAWLGAGHGERREVWGHQELSPTSCPGTLMADFVWPYRAGRLGREEARVASGYYFPETGHYVGHAFWDYWRAHGGLMQFGYPLTEELVEDGRTVQYFERAVFEWWPENPDPYKVLLRRLGAEALARRPG